MNPPDQIKTTHGIKLLISMLWENTKNQIYGTRYLVEYIPLIIETIYLIWSGQLILRFWVLINMIHTLVSMRYRLTCIDNSSLLTLIMFGKIIIGSGLFIILYNMMYIDMTNICNVLITGYLILRTHRNMYRILN
jgi:hypothetical protein